MIADRGGQSRELKRKELSAALTVVGGGISGVCAAIAAARQGLDVLLVQDRPVLGGNASSEVRLWMLGATSHMGNNNRWAREGGLVDEILVENMYRNPEGNPLIFDTILMDMVKAESRITLLLNTAAFQVEQDADGNIQAVDAYCSQNQTMYRLHAPFFADASGDGILGFLAGAAFRMGAESASEFGEKFAPSSGYGELLGHSLYFYSKDTGRPVQFHPPAFALKDISAIPRFKSFNAKDFGCRLWWIEYGGRKDTVHDTEEIKWELWKVVYGVWNHIKNSGAFPEAENLTLEWVGTIPGKRESRRFEGDYMLTQQDIVEQRSHEDAVAYGGWSIDLHPADGIYSDLEGCSQWHSKGVYQIPYRALYSRNIPNLLLAGRLISASHVAFGSSRVMATCGLIGEVVGTSVALCLLHQCKPADLVRQKRIPELQLLLYRAGVYIPGVAIRDEANLLHKATMHASGTFRFNGFDHSGGYRKLDVSLAQMIPVEAGRIPAITVAYLAEVQSKLHVEFRISSKPQNHTPDLLLESMTFDLQNGEAVLQVCSEVHMPHAGYVYLIFRSNPDVALACSNQRITGILSLFNASNPSVSNWGIQSPPPEIGMDSFEFWCPQRRPLGKNLAFSMHAFPSFFDVSHLLNGIDRPVSLPNAWVADQQDPDPTITVEWPMEQVISVITIAFDNDFDHPMESVLMGHPERTMPFCVKDFYVEDGNGSIIWEVSDNHRTRCHRILDIPVATRMLTFHFKHPSALIPAAVFSIACYHEYNQQ